MVSNTGPSNATGASVADAVPANITGVTANCVATGTASCGPTPRWATRCPSPA
ncbi:MAG: hypothetical protein IPI73_16935 [Betaproteobacteria bacterium]|nr:hypothetical protein [Betaproteobacteria bacterium]